MLEIVLITLCALPAVIPLVLAFCIWRSGHGSIALGFMASGILTGIYTYNMWGYIARKAAGGGDFKGIAVLFLPVAAAIFSIFLALSIGSLLILLSNAALGRIANASSVVAGVLLAISMVLAALYGTQFFAWPHL